MSEIDDLYCPRGIAIQELYAQGDHEDATKYKQKLKDLNAKHPALGITEDTFAKSKTMFHDASKRSVNGVVFSKKMYSEMMQNASEYEQ